MYIPLKPFQTKTPFTGDVSVHWTTGRRWQVKLFGYMAGNSDTFSPRQETVKLHEFFVTASIKNVKYNAQNVLQYLTGADGKRSKLDEKKSPNLVTFSFLIH